MPMATYLSHNSFVIIFPLVSLYNSAKRSTHKSHPLSCASQPDIIGTIHLMYNCNWYNRLIASISEWKARLTLTRIHTLHWSLWIWLSHISNCSSVENTHCKAWIKYVLVSNRCSEKCAIDYILKSISRVVPPKSCSPPISSWLGNFEIIHSSLEIWGVWGTPFR